MPQIEFRAESRTVSCAPDTPLRDVCDQEKAKVPFGCRNGVCGTCEVIILSGAENLSPIVDPEKDTLASFGIPGGHRLACQARVLGDCALQPI